jgi:hypothetical protein
MKRVRISDSTHTEWAVKIRPVTVVGMAEHCVQIEGANFCITLTKDQPAAMGEALIGMATWREST